MIDLFSIEAIIVFVSSIIIISIAIDDIRLRLDKKRLIDSIVQLSLDLTLTRKSLQDAKVSPTELDGFVKFLSDSRSSAYDYIESVQAAIERYLVAIENKNEDEIITARLELFSYLPESPDKV
jgi:hypothetical protein